MGSAPSVYSQEKDVSRLEPSGLEELLRGNGFEFISKKFREFGVSGELLLFFAHLFLKQVIRPGADCAVTECELHQLLAHNEAEVAKFTKWVATLMINHYANISGSEIKVLYDNPESSFEDKWEYGSTNDTDSEIKVPFDNPESLSEEKWEFGSTNETVGKQLFDERVSNPQMELNTRESTALIKWCIMQATANTSFVKEREGVVLIGNSGAGKSTTSNFLQNCTFRYTNQASQFKLKSLEVVPESEGGRKDAMAEIGHGYASKTWLPNIIKNPKLKFVTCDFPGFF